MSLFQQPARAFSIHDKGFTLLELLVAVGILGILVAFAIPQYNAYRRRAFIAAIKSDLKNASIVQEAYFAETETYTDSLPTLLSKGYNQSSKVTISVSVLGQTYNFSATHANCGTDTWTYTGSGTITDPPTPCQ